MQISLIDAICLVTVERGKSRDTISFVKLYQNLDMLYSILKHVILRIRIYSLFREIFKYRENMSNNRFREIYKSFLKIAKETNYIFVFSRSHYVMENGENQHTFIRRSEIAFPSTRHSMVK